MSSCLTFGLGWGDNFYPAEMIRGEKRRLTLTRTYCYTELAREVTGMVFFPSALGKNNGLGKGKKKQRKQFAREGEKVAFHINGQSW